MHEGTRMRSQSRPIRIPEFISLWWIFSSDIAKEYYHERSMESGWQRIWTHLITARSDLSRKINRFEIVKSRCVTRLHLSTKIVSDWRIWITIKSSIITPLHVSSRLAALPLSLILYSSAPLFQHVCRLRAETTAAERSIFFWVISLLFDMTMIVLLTLVSCAGHVQWSCANSQNIGSWNFGMIDCKKKKAHKKLEDRFINWHL